MEEHAWSGVKVCAGCEGYLQEVKHADCQQADVEQVKHVDAPRHNVACNRKRHHVATHVARNRHGNKLGKLHYEAGQRRAAESAAKLVQLPSAVACAQDVTRPRARSRVVCTSIRQSPNMRIYAFYNLFF